MGRRKKHRGQASASRSRAGHNQERASPTIHFCICNKMALAQGPSLSGLGIMKSMFHTTLVISFNHGTECDLKRLPSLLPLKRATRATGVTNSAAVRTARGGGRLPWTFPPNVELSYLAHSWSCEYSERGRLCVVPTHIMFLERSKSNISQIFWPEP